MSKTNEISDAFYDFKDFDWSDGKMEASLNKSFDIVIGNAASLSKWYIDKVKQNRFWALILRTVAIVASTLGAGIPVISKLFGDQYNRSWISIEIAAVVVSFGIAAILLDRFYGYFSS